VIQRYTFVVRVHPGEGATVENLATREQAAVTDVAAVGSQIERWLKELGDGAAVTPVAAQEEEK
jgi:hypothetical protein